MITRSPCRWAAIILVCIVLPTTGMAQTIGFEPVGPANVGPAGRALWVAGGGAPYYPWGGYPGLRAGPYMGYAYPYSWPYYSGANGATWSNGLSLLAPPVPTYGPIPGMFGASDLNAQWRAHPSLGYGLGWVGVYSASPRPRPLSVNVWPTNDPRAFAAHHGKVYRNGVITEQVPGPIVQPVQPGGCIVLSVRVPQPAAEVFVEGVKMSQTGTDRIFESPPVEAGNSYQYELTARWVERGVMKECKKTVIGKPGEVVRVDFLAPDVIVTSGK
jgi:uncharacterized protein (TIGR03000 family)